MVSSMCQSRIMDENLSQMKNIEAEREALREQYHISEDSQEEKEQQIEAAKERKKEQEEWLDNLSDITIDIAADTADASDAQQEIKEMMTKMKLIEEDIKGAAVDEIV